MYLTQSLHQAVQRWPDKPVTVFRGRSRSYRQLAERAARLAGALAALGLRRGDRLAVLAQNSDRYVEICHALWWMGAVANPVNTRWSAPEIAQGIDDCESRFLIVDDAFLPMMAEIRERARSLERVVHAGDGPSPAKHAGRMLSYEELIAGAGPTADLRCEGDELAAVLYTGGTTGSPRGVMLTHANLWASAAGRLAAFSLPAESRTLLATPLFHVAGLGRLICQLAAGATGVILPSFRADAVLDTVEAERVDDLPLVPTMLQMLLDSPAFNSHRLAGVRRVGFGASPMSGELLQRAMRALPGRSFLQAYGMTETAGTVALNALEDAAEGPSREPRVTSMGRAIPGVEIRVVDERGVEMPRGSVGEIVVRGGCVTRGYWRRAEETKAVLRNGWLHTGDGASMDGEGYLYMFDRIKDMVISGGENVYSLEVESVILKHPGVAACAIIGVPSVEWGESVHAVVVPRTDAVLDEPAIRAHCRQWLAGFKCPKSVEFRDALPLSAAGKVLKTVLREPHWHGRDRRVN